jgi:hypothetical protein
MVVHVSTGSRVSGSNLWSSKACPWSAQISDTTLWPEKSHILFISTRPLTSSSNGGGFAKRLTRVSGRLAGRRKRYPELIETADRFDRQIMFGPSNLPNIDFKAWNARRNAFIKLCPNLERVRDDSGEIACNKHVFPASLTHLRLLLRSDKTNVQTIHAPGLQNLHIGLDPLGLTEFAVAHLAAGFPKRLAKILRHVKKLDRLEMQLPGLPLRFHENITELQLPDPIPASLETLGSLELEIPFCTIDHESLRATAWVSSFLILPGFSSVITTC